MKKRQWPNDKKAKFLQQTGQLLARGYSLSNSLTLYALHEKPKIKRAITDMITQLKNGDQLYKVLKQHYFPNDIITHLYFYDYYDLASGLIQSGKMLEKQEYFKKRLQKVLQYPLFLIWLSFIMLFMLVHYLFPQFIQLFTTVNSDIPLLTKLLILFVQSLPSFALVGIFFLFLATLYYVTKIHKQSPRHKLTLLHCVPFVRTMIELLITYRFSLNLSSLLHSGLSINEALSIFERQNHSLFLQQEANAIKLHLNKGERLEAILASRSLYRKELPTIIYQGQMSGKLADELAIYADDLFTRIEESLLKTLTVLQPTIFFFVGTLILCMFLSIMLPMLQFLQSL